jgi:signal peptidase I
MKYNSIQDIYEWIEAIVFSVAAIVIVFTFAFRIVGVSGVSMENTLNAGVQYENQTVDRVVISDINYKPKRGDIIVLSTKAVPEPIIKRVIAVGGDTVNIDFNKHTVSVNGKIIKEPYIKEPTTNPGDVTFPVKVPEGHVFVMGDNRNNSEDSRFRAVGMVDDRYILGRACLRIFPLNEIKIIH